MPTVVMLTPRVAKKLVRSGFTASAISGFLARKPSSGYLAAPWAAACWMGPGMSNLHAVGRDLALLEVFLGLKTRLHGTVAFKGDEEAGLRCVDFDIFRPVIRFNAAGREPDDE